MGGDKKLRLAWRIAVTLVLVACAFYVGCASPEAPSGAAAQGGMPSTAEAEGQGEGALPIDQLYSNANEAYVNGNYEEAYGLYRQILARQDEVSEERLETVAARVQELHGVKQGKQRQARKVKAAETLLERINSLVEQGTIEEAHQHVEMLKENNLVQYLGREERKELATLQQEIQKSMGGVARARLKELKNLCAQNEWEKARAKSVALDDLVIYLNPDEQRDLADRRVAIFQATGAASVIPKSQRQELARDWFEQGMDAYDNNNYVVAQKYLNWTKELEVDLGWWDNWSLRDAHEDVNEVIRRMRKRYARGERLLKLGQPDEAETEFRAVAECEYDLPPKMVRGARKYLDQIWRGQTEEAAKVAQKEAEEQKEAKTEPAKEEVPVTEKEEEAAEVEKEVTEEEPAEEKVVQPEPEEKEPVKEVAQREPAEQEVEKKEPKKKQAEPKEVEREVKEVAPVTPPKHEEPVSQQDLALVEQLEEQAATLARKRKQILQSKQVYRERKQKVESLLAEANGLWSSGKYSQSKTKLREAERALGRVKAPMDPDLQKAADEIDHKLSYVDEKIKKQQAEVQKKEIARTEINNLFQEARYHYPERLLESEDKVIQYKNLADRRGLTLTQKQREMYEKVIEEAVDKYGDRRERRRKYYAPLVSESQKYMNVGEYRHARDVLKLARKDLAPLLTEKEKERIKKTLATVEDQILQQKPVMDRVEELEKEAETLADEGQLAKAERAYKQALDVAREAGLPHSAQLQILKGYASVLSEWETSVPAKESLDQSWARVKEKVRNIRDLTPYYQAKHYVEAGSPDLAKPYLRDVASGGAAFDRQMQQWAKKQLQNIDQRIENLKNRERLRVSQELTNVVRLEKRFEEKAELLHGEELDRLLQSVADARLNLQIAKIQNRLSRAAYPLAADIVENTSLQHASESLVQQFRTLQRRVGAWQSSEQVLKDLEQQLLNKDVLAAQESMSKLHTLKPDLGCWYTVVRRLEDVWDTAQAVKKARQDIVAGKMERLAQVRNQMDEIRQRQDAYQKYSAARSAFVSAEWGRAATELEHLDSAPAGLLSFEQKRVSTMLADAGEIMDAIQKARGVYAEAETAFQDGNSLKAAKALERLRQMEGYALDEKLAKKAGNLSDEIAEKERDAIADAESMFSRAQEAYESTHYAKASDLIGGLRGMGGAHYDPQLWSRIEDLRAKLRGRMDQEIREGQDLLASAEAAYDNGQIVEAWNAVEKLKGSPGYAVDSKLAAATDALHEDVWQARQDKITEARKMLTAARSKFEIKEYREASQILENLRGTAGYTLAEDIPTRAKELSSKIARKEKEARELYQKAVQAYEANDRHRLQKLLSELRKDYRYTETYQSRDM